MSNTPNQEPNPNPNSYSNPAPSENYGNTTPQSPPDYASAGNYGTPPNYAPQEQGNYGTPPNYPPQGNYGAPPPNYSSNVPAGYGAPYPPNVPPNYGYNPPPASSPLPLGDEIRQLPSQYWRVVSKPGAATFAAEKGKAAWNIIWVQIAILTIISVLVSFVLFNVTLPAQLNAQLGASNLPPNTFDALRSTFGFLPFSYIILIPLGIFIVTGIYHLIAKAFGGDGTFVEYLYSYLLYYVPIAIVSSIFTIIPFVGSLVASALGIYGFVLQVFMTMAVHRLSGGRATLAVLILPIILFVLFIIGFIVLIAVIAAALQHR